jgi:hypothetical protein
MCWSDLAFWEKHMRFLENHEQWLLSAANWQIVRPKQSLIDGSKDGSDYCRNDFRRQAGNI